MAEQYKEDWPWKPTGDGKTIVEKNPALKHWLIANTHVICPVWDDGYLYLYENGELIRKETKSRSLFREMWEIADSMSGDGDHSCLGMRQSKTSELLNRFIYDVKNTRKYMIPTKATLDKLFDDEKMKQLRKVKRLRTAPEGTPERIERLYELYKLIEFKKA